MQASGDRGGHFEKMAGLPSSRQQQRTFQLLDQGSVVTFYQDGKQLAISVGDSISSKPPLCDPHSLSPCTRKEDHIHLLLHANRAALCGHFKVLIGTVDTDVVVLAVCYSTTGSRL